MIVMQNGSISSAKFLNNDALEDMAIMVIDSNNVIFHCNQSVGQLFNCNPSKILRKNISTILPQLQNIQLVQEENVNPELRFLSRVGHHFEVVALDGRRFDSKLYFKLVEDSGGYCLRLIIKPVDIGLVDGRVQ